MQKFSERGRIVPLNIMKYFLKFGELFKNTLKILTGEGNKFGLREIYVPAFTLLLT